MPDADGLTGRQTDGQGKPAIWPSYEAVIASTLQFSIIRWRNAAPRPEVMETQL
jgi:hypothetical protein